MLTTSLIFYFLMQADSNEGISQTVTLPLAERMIKKFVDDGKIEAEAEMQLYLMVLEKQVNLGEKLVLNFIDAFHLDNYLNRRNLKRRWRFWMDPCHKSTCPLEQLSPKRATIYGS